jgi:hypothetical protein
MLPENNSETCSKSGQPDGFQDEKGFCDYYNVLSDDDKSLVPVSDDANLPKLFVRLTRAAELVFGDKPSVGFICGVKESQKMAGSCCLDSPFGQFWGTAVSGIAASLFLVFYVISLRLITHGFIHYFLHSINVSLHVNAQAHSWLGLLHAGSLCFRKISEVEPG